MKFRKFSALLWSFLLLAAAGCQSRAGESPSTLPPSSAAANAAPLALRRLHIVTDMTGEPSRAQTARARRGA
jgi:hypothetical protein